MKETRPIFLGVNVDHIATLRNARGVKYPCPVHAALQAELAGADGITAHLREDRRHITDSDIEQLAKMVQTRLNLEMAVTEEMLTIAEKVKPAHCCLVPEKREELTTEGGLNVAAQLDKISQACQRLAAIDCEVSLFIDPEPAQIEAAVQCQAPAIELHTGGYADAKSSQEQQSILKRIEQAAELADQKGLIVNAGHGLTLHNVAAIAAIKQINELNIGHALVADATFLGIADAVRAYKKIMQQARATQ